MMIKNGAGSESYNIHMLRLSVSIHDTSVNVPQTHEIAESAMRSQLDLDDLMADQEGAQGLKGLELGGEIICKDDFSRLKKRHLLIGPSRH